jgi:hypothetical protein
MYAFARQRVTLCKEGLPERTVWLVIKRPWGADPRFSYSISHAPASTPWRTFVGRSGLRGAIEIVYPQMTTRERFSLGPRGHPGANFPLPVIDKAPVNK